MDTKLLGYIISLAIMVIWGIGFYFYKRNDKRKDDSIALLFTQTNQQEVSITKLQGEIVNLNGKLWKESKLEKIIKSAIKSEFMEWEIRLMKEGVLKPRG